MNTGHAKAQHNPLKNLENLGRGAVSLHLDLTDEFCFVGVAFAQFIVSLIVHFVYWAFVKELNSDL
jgi:hypothetical protein